MPAFEGPTADGNSSQQHAPPFQLEDLPGEAVVLLADHASSPATPAACLLPLVCRGWQAVASRVQLLVDICLDLAPSYRTEEPGAVTSWMQQPPSQSDPTASAAAAAAAPPPPAAAPGPAPPEAPAVLRGRQLAAWLAKHRGSVRSLRILSDENLMGPFIPAWDQDLALICEALTAPQQAPSGGIALPHLVQLELPMVGMPGYSAFLRALAGCTGLQQLKLKRARSFNSEDLDIDALAGLVAPLTRLRALHIDLWSICVPICVPFVEPGALARLLRALPPSLEDMQLIGLTCRGSVPLSCFTHLVKLRAWDWPHICTVEDDTTTNTTTTSSSSSTMSSASELTALTWLHVTPQLDTSDARLQLPNLQALRIDNMQHVADPAVCQQLQGMPHLQQLTVCFGVCTPTQEHADMLGRLTGLQQLQILDPCWSAESLATTGWKPWAAAVACLTRLSVLHLPAYVLLVGEPAVLAPLTMLRELTVDCSGPYKWASFPEHESCLVAWLLGNVVQVVAFAVKGSKGQLQRLELLAEGASDEPGAEVQQVIAGARADLPMLVVEVRWKRSWKAPLPLLPLPPIPDIFTAAEIEQLLALAQV